MKDVFIVSGARTPVGKRNGYLRDYTVPVLLGKVLDAVADRAGVEPGVIDDVVVGTVYQLGEQGFTLARTGVYASRYPDSVPGMSVNRQCGSGLSAVQIGYGMIASGVMDVVVAGGCEMMTKYPIASDMNGTLFNGMPMGHPMAEYYVKRVNGHLWDQMNAAQQIAYKYGITSGECMEFAVASHKNAARATENGWFRKEIVPVEGKDKDGNAIVQDRDETVRPDTSVEKLATLQPVSGTEFITAGISSPVTDGASAVLLMGGDKVRELGLSPLARVVANAVVGSEPDLMLTGPIIATPKVLKKAGLALNDIDLFEVNEAFAPIPLAWAKELGADREKLNVNGGAIALGHPVGSSGTRLVLTAACELQRRKARYALITLCTGVAMAPATIIERV
ncbi:MAG: thiolase family protein [Deltaproteobacteria bacterium]|nr:thiolase family protein [Deltaproteobacteria bacterium]